jgi:hypothetical protein
VFVTGAFPGPARPSRTHSSNYTPFGDPLKLEREDLAAVGVEHWASAGKGARPRGVRMSLASLKTYEERHAIGAALAANNDPPLGRRASSSSPTHRDPDAPSALRIARAWQIIRFGNQCGKNYPRSASSCRH